MCQPHTLRLTKTEELLEGYRLELTDCEIECNRLRLLLARYVTHVLHSESVNFLEHFPLPGSPLTSEERDEILKIWHEIPDSVVYRDDEKTQGEQS